MRENGDYEIEVELGDEDAEQVLRDARDFLAKVEELINPALACKGGVNPNA